MDTDEIFARADRMIDQLSTLRGAAHQATALQEGRLSALLASSDRIGTEASSVEKHTGSAESKFLESLSDLTGDIVSCLDEAKPVYLVAVLPEPAKARQGLLGRVFGRKAESDLSDGTSDLPTPLAAQAAFSGREARLAKLFSLVDDAISSIPARRTFLEETVFRLQERAVGLAVEGGTKAEAGARRELFAVEEFASLLAAHSDELALRARVLAATDRSSCGIEDDVAAAAEAHMDSLEDADLNP